MTSEKNGIIASACLKWQFLNILVELDQHATINETVSIAACKCLTVLKVAFNTSSTVPDFGQ